MRSGGSGFTGAVSSLVDNAGHPGQTHRSEHWRKLLSLIESDVRRWAGGGCGDRRVRPGRGRRGLADLVTATARPRWAAQLATWAATAIWAVGAYLVFVGVMFAVYAHQGVTGTPPWWWVVAGTTADHRLPTVAFRDHRTTLGTPLPDLQATSR